MSLKFEFCHIVCRVFRCFNVVNSLMFSVLFAVRQKRRNYLSERSCICEAACKTWNLAEVLQFGCCQLFLRHFVHLEHHLVVIVTKIKNV